MTLGLCYERKGNFAGGAYHPILRRLEEFSSESLQKALAVHERYAEQVFELDEQVTAIVAKLKDRGLMSPYLRNFVVARVNPLRWIKDEPPPLPRSAQDHARAPVAIQRREGQSAGPGARWAAAAEPE